MRVKLSEQEWGAVEAALVEYGFSTENGGANEGDAQAEARWRLIASLVNNVSREAEIGEDELEALRALAQEFAFSTEDGGANEGDTQAAAQLSVLESLIGRLEEPPREDVAFVAEPRSRLSDLAEE